MADSGEDDMNCSEKNCNFSKNTDQCSDVHETESPIQVKGSSGGQYLPPGIQPPVIQPSEMLEYQLTGNQGLQGNAIETRSNDDMHETESPLQVKGPPDGQYQPHGIQPPVIQPSEMLEYQLTGNQGLQGNAIETRSNDDMHETEAPIQVKGSSGGQYQPHGIQPPVIQPSEMLEYQLTGIQGLQGNAIETRSNDDMHETESPIQVKGPPTSEDHEPHGIQPPVIQPSEMMEFHFTGIQGLQGNAIDTRSIDDMDETESPLQVEGPLGGDYQPPVIPHSEMLQYQLTEIQGLQGNAIETRSNDDTDEVVPSIPVGPPSVNFQFPITTGDILQDLRGSTLTKQANVSLDESDFIEITLMDESDIEDDTGFWDETSIGDKAKHVDDVSLVVKNGMENEANLENKTGMNYEASLAVDNGVEDPANNLRDGVSLAVKNGMEDEASLENKTGMNYEASLAVDNGVEDPANNLRDGISLAVENGMEDEASLENGTAMNCEASYAADNGMEDPANNLRDGVSLVVENGMENEANLENETGMNYEASLADDNREEDEASAVIESGMDDEAQRTALSLRSSMGDAYLDGPSTDLEIVDNLGLFRRPYNYITENFNKEPKEITVERGSVYTTLSQFYKENRSIHQTEVKFEDEPGVGLGPLKEALRLFHKEGKDWLYEGDGEMIPRTSGDKSKALGRALSDSLFFNGGFPPFLSKAFIFKMLTGRDIDEEYLFKSYINFLSISSNDKSNLLSAVKDGLSSETKTKLFEIISREKEIKIAQNIAPNYFNDRVNETNWRQFMIDLAHFELTEKPACVEVDNEFKLCMTMEGYELGSVDEAKQIIENMNPSPQSITDMLETEDSPLTLTQDEKKTYGFLERFITSECIEDNIAELFLMFCTSSTNLPLAPILIDFNSVSGLARAVTANTCANLLHLPCTYKSYPEFKEEFMNTLTSTESSTFTSM